MLKLILYKLITYKVVPNSKGDLLKKQDVIQALEFILENKEYIFTNTNKLLDNLKENQPNKEN